jgi:hypothetical protein
MNHRRTASLLGLVFLALLADSAGADEKATLLGTFAGWKSYTLPEAHSEICYALTNPAKADDKVKRSTKPLLMVTHRPGEKIYNVVSLLIGYDLPADGSAAVTVGKAKFDFFTKTETAWSRDSDTDKAVVTAMIKATDLTVKTKPAKGPETTDSYSLAGFTDALAAIDKACKVKR